MHAARSAFGVVSHVMVSTVAGPTDTNGVFVAGKTWLGHLSRLLSQLRAAIW